MIYDKHYIYVEACSSSDTWEVYMNKLKTAFDNALGVECQLDYSYECRLIIPDFDGEIDPQKNMIGIAAHAQKTANCSSGQNVMHYLHWGPALPVGDYWNSHLIYQHINGRPNSGNANSTSSYFFMNPLVDNIYVVDTRFMQSGIILLSFIPKTDSNVSGEMITDGQPNFCIQPIILAKVYSKRTKTYGTSLIRETGGFRTIIDNDFYTGPSNVSDCINTARIYSSDTFITYTNIQPAPCLFEDTYIATGNSALSNYLSLSQMSLGDYVKTGIKIDNKNYAGLITANKSSTPILIEDKFS